MAATAVAAVAGLAPWATRRPGGVAGALVGPISGTALVGGAVRRAYLWWWHGSADPAPLQPVQVVVEVVAVLVITLVLPLHRSTGLWALALTVLVWWLADALIEALLHGTGVIR